MFPTRDDLFRIARDTVLLKNAALTADAVERDGTDANLLIAAGAAMGDKVVGQLMLVVSGLYLDSAQKQRLDRLVFDRYGLVRKPAAPSQVNLAFSLPSPAASSFSIPVGTTVSTSDGVQFVTVVASAILAGTSGPVYVPARSLLAGADQQVGRGLITQVTSGVPGAPAGLACTNNAASAGAANAESDDALKDRARRFWTTAVRGTLAAIEAGALAVPGVVRAAAIEALDGSSRPGRWVFLVVADTFTDALASLNETSPSYQAQSQALATAVFQGLSNVRCGGIYVQVIVAQVVLMQFTLALTFAAGVDTLSVANNARAVVAGYINALDPGEAYDPGTALQRLRQVAGLVITGGEIVAPAGPVVPKVLQVLRTKAELIGASSSGLPIAATVDPDTILIAA